MPKVINSVEWSDPTPVVNEEVQLIVTVSPGQADRVDVVLSDDDHPDRSVPAPAGTEEVRLTYTFDSTEHRTAYVTLRSAGGNRSAVVTPVEDDEDETDETDDKRTEQT
ncbi:MAG: hypothetical protein ACI8PZ_003198 [Myxococcota bacterium]|jgi:hypothetical protein